MECKFCHNSFSNKQNLNSHQRKAKYCLKIQDVDPGYKYKCNICFKNFGNESSNYRKHIKKCESNQSFTKYNRKIEKLENKLREMDKENTKLHIEIELLRTDKKDLQQRYDKLSLTAVRRPANNTKNIQINNYIQNMEPLRLEDIKKSVPQLTLEHHVKGAEGYAEFALEFPFKDKIVCVDVNRNKIKYKNGDGDVIEDIGFRKMMMKLCDAVKDRTFDLCQEHYEKLSQQFTEEEVDKYNFTEAAMAITRFANGRENEFCNKVIN